MNPRTKTNAAIYREAARSLEVNGGYFACHAIEEAGGDKSHCDRMYKLFHAQGCFPFQAWLTERVETDDRETRANRRIVALCFMAAMVEAGDA